MPSTSRDPADRDPVRNERPESPPASCFWCLRLHASERALSVCPECVARYATLRSLEMQGSHALDDAVIDDVLTHTSAGNYALGYLDDGVFCVFYVGRANADLRERLHEWVGRPSSYERFAPTRRAAWATRSGCSPLGIPALGRVGTVADTAYTRFAFSYASSAEAAFEKECRNYEDFGGCRQLDNESAPAWMP